MPLCKMSPDTVVRRVEFARELLDRGAVTSKQLVMSNKENIYLIYC
jgi:hypothetical protein